MTDVTLEQLKSHAYDVIAGIESLQAEQFKQLVRDSIAGSPAMKQQVIDWIAWVKTPA